MGPLSLFWLSMRSGNVPLIETGDADAALNLAPRGVAVGTGPSSRPAWKIAVRRAEQTALNGAHPTHQPAAWFR